MIIRVTDDCPFDQFEQMERENKKIETETEKIGC
tara:strand:- start:519 stop:620 length:102 start_codon:yes stop_codon:yes gene_type:complete